MTVWRMLPLIVAPLASLLAQILLAVMPEAETALERIRLAPELWTAAHALISVSLGAFILIAVDLAARLRFCAWAIVALVVTIAGVLVAATVNGVDAVLGVLADFGDKEVAGDIHRSLAEGIVAPLDRWDIALVAGLALLVVLVHSAGIVPWWATAAALVGLAVPAFADLRIVAAAAVLIGFSALAVASHRGLDVALAPRAELIVSAAIAAAYVPAALFSVERAALLAIVLVALAVTALQRRSEFVRGARGGT